MHGGVGLAIGDDVEDHSLRVQGVLDEGIGDDGGSKDIVGCEDEVEEIVVDEGWNALRHGDLEAGRGVGRVFIG